MEIGIKKKSHFKQQIVLLKVENKMAILGSDGEKTEK